MSVIKHIPVFDINKTYAAILNGEDRTFTVLGFDGLMYAIRWDDGEEEWAYPADMENWVKRSE